MKYNNMKYNRMKYNSMKYNPIKLLQSVANSVYNVVFSSYPRMIFWSAVYALVILIVKGN